MFRHLPKFEYLEPKTLHEACAMLARYHGQAKVMAGGTGLVPQMKWRQITPAYVIGLTNLSGLDSIEYSESEGLTLGALVRIRTIEQSPTLRDRYPVLVQAASLLGPIEIRNLATLGGNLCHASPSANMALALLVLGAEVQLISESGERVLPLDAFFKGPNQTGLSSSEILMKVSIPQVPSDSRGAYLKIGIRNTPLERAVVAVATRLVLDSKGGTFEDAKIALGAVAPIPMRARRSEGILIGRKVDDRVIEEAANIASQEANPISDLSASVEYRREMVSVLVRRAIQESLEKGRSSL